MAVTDQEHLHPPADADVSQEMAEVHKRLVTKVVLPVLFVLSVLFIVAYLEMTPRRIIGNLMVVGMISINVFLTSKNRVFKLGGFRAESRSDGADCCRWLFNLLIGDVATIYVTHPDSSAGFYAIWLVFMTGALLDTFQKWYRALVLGVGLLSGAVLCAVMYPEIRLREAFYFHACLGGVMGIIWAVERHWLQYMVTARSAQKRMMDSALLVDRLKTEAALGGLLSTVAHELNNTMMILDFSIDRNDPREVRIGRATDQIKRISNLILGTHRQGAGTRVLEVRALFDDIQLMLSRYVTKKDVDWEVELEPEAAGLHFVERPGAVYFILQNLVKNALEAVLARTDRLIGSGRVTVGARRVGETLALFVRDDGIGMGPETRRLFLEGASVPTAKEKGHGIGLRFVFDECSRAGYRLELDSEPGRGTEVRILLPVTAAGSKAA